MGNVQGGPPPKDPIAASLAVARHVLQRTRGQRFEDHYVAKRLLGTGAYAKVVECIKKEDDAPGGPRPGVERWAAKLIDKGTSKREDVEREVAVMLLLSDHPATLRLHQVYETEESFVIVMEECTGGTLFDRLVAKGRFTEREAAPVLRALLRFLAHAHDTGVVHRDMKLENLLRTDVADERAMIKVIDMGCAAFCPLGGDKKLKDRLGSPHYIPPEILAAHEYDHSCDIWSLGVVAFALLSGRMPFAAGSENEVLKKVKKGEYSMECEAWEHVSPAAREMVRSMLQVDPARRPTAKQLLQHDWLYGSAAASVTGPEAAALAAGAAAAAAGSDSGSGSTPADGGGAKAVVVSPPGTERMGHGAGNGCGGGGPGGVAEGAEGSGGGGVGGGGSGGGEVRSRDKSGSGCCC